MQQVVMQCCFELKDKLNKQVYSDLLTIIGMSYVPAESADDTEKDKLYNEKQRIELQLSF